MTLAKESTTFHQKVHAFGDLNISHPADVRPPRRPLVSAPGPGQSSGIPSRSWLTSVPQRIA